MRKGLFFVLMVGLIGVLVACGKEDVKNESDELAMLEVDFTVPETAEPGETVELIADLSYEDKPVTDADEVLFEIWESGHEDNSEKIEGVNQEDGTYTLEYTFEEDGIYEIYAHSTAHSMHTMPKKQIEVGDAKASKQESDAGEAHFHTEGFDLQFVEPKNPTTENDTELMTHLTLNEKALEDVNVRYEIWPESDDDAIEWVDAEEDKAGEYTGAYTFPEPGTYGIQIHVQDNEELHEHIVYKIDVK